MGKEKIRVAVLVGPIAVVLAAIIGVWAESRPTELAIQATQTAESRNAVSVTLPDESSGGSHNSIVIGNDVNNSTIIQSDEVNILPSEDHPLVPNINGLPYSDARKIIVDSGWQPSNMYYEVMKKDDIFQELYLGKGYFEVEDCSGTGLGFCRFEFHDEHQNILRIITTGGMENPIVDAWYLNPEW